MLNVIGGIVMLALGIFLWVAFLAASAFSVGFGGKEVSALWFLIPAIVTFGGPGLFWTCAASAEAQAAQVSKERRA